MGSLGDVLGAAIGARARGLAAEAAAPKPATARRLVARGRGRGVGAVVAAAALVSAGVWWQGADGTVTPAPGPSPAIDGQATVTVPLDADAWHGTLDGTPFGCGLPVPEPHTSERGFTLDVVTDVKNGDGAPLPTVTAELNHDGEIYDNALVSAPFALVVKDGVVVGTLWPYLVENDGPVMRIGEQDRVSFFRLTAGDWGSAAFEACPTGVWQGDRDPVLLPAGDYELVVAHTVRHTAASLALVELDRSGYSLGGSRSGLWTPGSIDCREAIAYDIEYGGETLPLQCEPLGVEGIDIDAEAGTASLSYGEAAGSRDLDIVLASEPIPWRLEQDHTWADYGFGSADGAEPAELADLSCGPFENTTNPPMLGAATSAELPQDLASRGGGEVALDVNWVSRADSGTLSTRASAPALLLAWGQEGNVVYGTATATISPHQDIDFDRAADYVRLTVELTHLKLCDGVDPFANAWHPTRFAVIFAPSVVEGDDGSRETAEAIWVEFGEER